jgi:hypothetical protein
LNSCAASWLAFSALIRVADKAGAAKTKSLDGLLIRTPPVSEFPAMWPREPTAHSGDIAAVSNRPWEKQSLRVLQRSTAVCDAAKNTKSLAARVGC